MRKDENGYIVVETIGSFMLFVFFTVSILTLINITTLQTRVHYAMTQTANELAMYSYVLHVLGISDAIIEAAATGAEVQGQIDSAIGDVNAIRQGVAGGVSGGDFLNNLDIVMGALGSLGNTAGSIMDDPQGTLSNLLTFAIGGIGNYAMQELIVRPTLYRHLGGAGGRAGAGVFLQRFNVIGEINLHDSRVIYANGNILIVAEYTIDYAFGLGILPLPRAVRELTVRQTVMTKAWLGGI